METAAIASVLAACSLSISFSSSTLASKSARSSHAEMSSEPVSKQTKSSSTSETSKKSSSSQTCASMTGGSGSPSKISASCPSWTEKSPVDPDTDASVSKLRSSKGADVLFDGDSITAQLGTAGNAALSTYLPGVSTLVTAVPGDTTGRMVWRWCQTGAFPIAKVFVIGIGTNDLTLDPSEIVKRHETIRDILRAKNPKSAIIFTALWWRNAMLDRVEKLNSLIEQMVKKSDSLVFYAPHTRQAANDASGFLDGVHPNPSSWNKALEGLAPCVRKALTLSG